MKCVQDKRGMPCTPDDRARRFPPRSTSGATADEHESMRVAHLDKTLPEYGEVVCITGHIAWRARQMPRLVRSCCPLFACTR